MSLVHVFRSVITPVWNFLEALGTTWTKYYCQYKKETKEFFMILYNQIGGKLVNLYHQFWLSIAFVNIFFMFLMKINGI